MSGGDRVQSALIDLYTDYELYRQAEEEDNKKDDNKDGIADVDQMVRAPHMPRCVLILLPASQRGGDRVAQHAIRPCPRVKTGRA